MRVFESVVMYENGVLLEITALAVAPSLIARFCIPFDGNSTSNRFVKYGFARSCMRVDEI